MTDALVVVYGESAGGTIPVVGSVELGRDVEGPGRFPNDKGISRHHARIECRSDGILVLTDLGSRNGTLVNGWRIWLPTSMKGRIFPSLGLLVVQLMVGRAADTHGLVVTAAERFSLGAEC